MTTIKNEDILKMQISSNQKYWELDFRFWILGLSDFLQYRNS